jgi:uncharacterized membrane protein (UPF0136 family)
MTRKRLDGLYLLLLGGAAFVLLGAALENASRFPMIDFKGLYYPARCLLQHSDPYAGSAVLRIYQTEGTDHHLDTPGVQQVVTRYVNFPTTFSLTAPVAMLAWRPAHLLWMALIVGSLIFASFLIWCLSADYDSIVSGALIGFLLANSELLVITGNMAGIAIALCVVAVWCFLRERFVPAGILCLAVSLACKPHDAGLVWLYFLLAGGVYRKRALETLLATVAVSLPAALWVWNVAPNWMQEWRSNLLMFSAHGALNDPGLNSTGAHGVGMIVSLQEAVSALWDDPRVYNPVSYLICAPLLLVWAIVTLRSRPARREFWLGLAAIAALSMLPVYHRQMDTKLLLLTVPACAMLWDEGGLIGWLALLVNSAGFVLTGDCPWSIILGLICNMHLPSTRLTGQIVTAVEVFPIPLILLVMGVFYLWVYVRRCAAHTSPQQLRTMQRQRTASPQEL